MKSGTPEALIVTPLAAEYVAEVKRLAESAIAVQPCRNVEELLGAYSGHRILFGNPGIIAPVLDELPDVQWLQSSWAGITPLVACTRRDYVLTGVKDVFGPQMSEYTFGYMLAHELKIAERHRQQANRQWFREHSGVLHGKTIGILGTGSIGKHIAGTAHAFNMTVHGLSRKGAAADNFDEVFDVGRLAEFLPTCDYLVSTLPQTAGTDNLLSGNTIELVRDGAFFINVGRSNVVDDAVLVQALESGKLSGAVLDVFDEEPLPQDSPLWAARNLQVTAHISAISHPLLIVPIFVANYQRFVDGRPLQYIIDLDEGY